jgi:AraC-like DNA-binding protein
LRSQSGGAFTGAHAIASRSIGIGEALECDAMDLSSAFEAVLVRADGRAGVDAHIERLTAHREHDRDSTFDASLVDRYTINVIGDNDDVAIAAITVAELQVSVRLVSGRRRAQRQSYVDDVCDVIPILTYDRWRGGELALHPGLVATYHPGAEHTGLNLPGFAFTFAVVDTESVMARAAELEVKLEQPERGLVEMPSDTPCIRSAVELLKLIRAQTNHGSLPARVIDDLLTSVILISANPGSNVHSPRLGKVNSWEVVTRCIEYAEAARRVPAIHELCLVGQVGESRLRQAFHDVYDISPVRFFRDWALTEAHHRLQLAEPGERSVTKIASDIGLTHLGRFAVQYRELFGECPSKTLAHARAQRAGVRYPPGGPLALAPFFSGSCFDL